MTTHTVIPLSKPSFTSTEEAALLRCLRSGWVTQGPEVSAFESEFATYVGSKHACAVSNCTVAMQLGLIALGVEIGDVVVTVSHSFIATANCIRAVGAEPYFVDIDAHTGNISAECLTRFFETKCSRRAQGVFLTDCSELFYPASTFTRLKSIYGELPSTLGRIAAIIVVHQTGVPCKIHEMKRVADLYGVPIIEDAACAAGSEYSELGSPKKVKIGKPVGAMACFSFHPRKLISTGDGGMICTDDGSIDSSCRDLRHHGMTVSDLSRRVATDYIKETYARTGFNFRMTDLQGSIGRVQLSRLEELIEERTRIVDQYRNRLIDNPIISIPEFQNDIRVNWQSLVVTFSSHRGETATQLVEFLWNRRIQAKTGIMNAHAQPPYAAGNWSLPGSETRTANTLILPLYSGMTTSEIDVICATVAEFTNSIV